MITDIDEPPRHPGRRKQDTHRGMHTLPALCMTVVEALVYHLDPPPGARYV
jgi:hypothetical protein